MDRHVVPADETVEQGGLARGAVVDCSSGRCIGAQPNHLFRGGAVVAASAIAAQEVRRAQARQPFAGRRVEQFGVEIEQCASRRSLVYNCTDAMIGADRPLSLQWAIQFEALLAMQDLR